MHYSKTIPALCLAFATLGYTQDVDSDDIPSQCRSVCDPIVSLTERCDREDNGDGDRRLNCVCTGPDASSQIPLCAACYAQYDPNDGNDNDVYDIVTSCSFSSTTYNPTATASSNSAGVTTSASTTVVTTTDAAGSSTTATSEVVMTVQTSTPASPSQTENAAVRGLVGGFGLAAGLAGLAGGLL